MKIWMHVSALVVCFGFLAPAAAHAAGSEGWVDSRECPDSLSAVYQSVRAVPWSEALESASRAIPEIRALWKSLASAPDLRADVRLATRGTGPVCVYRGHFGETSLLRTTDSAAGQQRDELVLSVVRLGDSSFWGVFSSGVESPGRESLGLSQDAASLSLQVPSELWFGPDGRWGVARWVVVGQAARSMVSTGSSR